ncbi:hypothetical protein Pmani_030647 [Petrolisthes manimaculis]|uniref:Transient receptor potential cation channel subfamily A member 1 n=1 Tax=Petrolisthes manimaculis TaxID=1843537 RepID=A0AAE1NXH8_9EUCA|nr:hypothetical protein Pmani_030647 [Petrolisthes manimaculis]
MASSRIIGMPAARQCSNRTLKKMTVTGTQKPLILTRVSRMRQKKDKKDKPDTRIVMEDRPHRFLHRPKLERGMSMASEYQAVTDGVQTRYSEEFLQLVEAKDYQGCKNILEDDSSKTMVQDEETQLTPLHVAAKNGQNDIVELLLANNADCNAQDITKTTPLHKAAAKDHFFCCETLLQCPDIQVNSPNKANDTPLHLAAKEGRYGICKLILKHPNVAINAKNSKGMSPLHLAAQENHPKVIELLLGNGANWNLQDKTFHLPLHYAAQKGYPEACETLMSSLEQADKHKLLKKILKDGKTPLMLAAKGGHHRCCIKLTNGNIDARDKEGNTALHYAAIGGFENTMAELLSMGADPNTRNKKGNSPISEAASKKKINGLMLLVDHKAKLDVLNDENKTILHCAAEKNAEDCLRYLFTEQHMKAQLDQVNNEGCTPLHLAIKRDAVESAELLLEYGASPTAHSKNGMTPLHLAAGKGFTGICEKLLANSDVQVSKENDDKATPLHMAAMQGSNDVCQMLIRKGARLTATDKHGRTPLHVAAVKGNANLVRFLSRKGISQKARDDTQSTALHLAASCGSLPACEILVNSAKATCTEVDHNGHLPLDRAFEKNHDEVFKYLLHNLPYKDTHEDRMLSLHKYMHTAVEDKRLVVVEAIIDSEWWESGFRGENGHHCHIFRDLVREHPDLAHKAQDKCIKKPSNPCDPDAVTTYKFLFYEDNYHVPKGKATSKLARSPYKSEGEGQGVSSNAQKFLTNDLEWKQTHPLTLMIQENRYHLLQHPLTNQWLIYKWRVYMLYIFIALLSMEIVSVLSLNIFMNYIDNWAHIEAISNLTREQICHVATMTPRPDNTTMTPPTPATESDTNMSSSPGGKVENSTIAQINTIMQKTEVKQRFWAFLLFVTLIIFLLEVNYIWRLRREYLNMEHWFRIMGVLFTIIVITPSCHCDFHYQVREVWQWQCGIVALLVAWMHLINTLNQLPIFSVFMPITGKFFKSFLKVVSYILMLIFVFAFVFHLLLKEHVAFMGIPQAVVKTIVWMLGDLGYDDTFLDDEHPILYPIMVNIIFVIFVTTLGGFIVNLAITQPSEKLDSFRSKATFHRASSRCRLFLRLDVCFPYFQKRRTHGTATDRRRTRFGTPFATRKLLLLDTIEEEKKSEEPVHHLLEMQKKQIDTLIKLQEQQYDDIKELKHQLNALFKVIPNHK